MAVEQGPRLQSEWPLMLDHSSPATRSPSQIALSSQAGFAHPARAAVLPSCSVEARGGVLIGPASAALIPSAPTFTDPRCRAALWAGEQIVLCGLRLAGLALAHLRTVVQVCRPEPSSFLSKRVNVVVPRRRAVTTISAAFSSVSVQGPCLLFEMQSNTDRMPWASTNTRHFIHGERA